MLKNGIQSQLGFRITEYTFYLKPCLISKYRYENENKIDLNLKTTKPLLSCVSYLI
jgi:hypothetical protein